ncbi:MAG: hypothetical protein ACI93H_000033 [Psychromonas sp.]|jgi:hypothetical protein
MDLTISLLASTNLMENAVYRTIQEVFLLRATSPIIQLLWRCVFQAKKTYLPGDTDFYFSLYKMLLSIKQSLFYILRYVVLLIIPHSVVFKFESVFTLFKPFEGKLRLKSQDIIMSTKKQEPLNGSTKRKVLVLSNKHLVQIYSFTLVLLQAKVLKR